MEKTVNKKICSKCGEPCEILFRRFYHDESGKRVYPVKAKAFPIPKCTKCES